MRVISTASPEPVTRLGGLPAVRVEAPAGANRSTRDSLRRAYRGAFGVSLASKVTGFLRELLIAHAFGASPVANLYFTAAQVPSYVQSFFFGAFALPTVPVLREMTLHGGGQRFRRRLQRKAVIAISLGALMGWGLMSLSYPSVPPLDRTGVAAFLLPLFICCAFVPTAGLAYCEWLARGETTRASALPALMNFSSFIVLAAGSLFFGNAPMILSVSLATGVIIQALLAIRHQPATAGKDESAKATVAIQARHRRGLGLAIGENLCFCAAFFWQTQLYGQAIAGGTALFFYAYRIANFPFLLFVAPAQQLAYRRGRTSGSERTQRRWIYLAITAVGLTAAAALEVIGPELIQGIYRRGAMTADACAAVADMAAPVCLSLLALSLVQTAGRYLSQAHRHAVYVAVVIPMYGVANGVRMALLPEHDLATVVLGGAAVEFCAAGLLMALGPKRSSS